MEEISTYLLVGFIAQIIDGALGMAYGVSANTFLLAFGVPPAVSSASVHAAEVFTTGASGLSHLRFGNVDRYLVTRLIVPGVIGAVLGAYILTSIDGNVIKPFVSLYLLAMGGYILWKALQKPRATQVQHHLTPLGLTGGFLDAIGGGGWGPIVVSTLVARGNNPRFTIGSVNAAEFFIALSASVTFVLTIGLSHWHVIIGLAAGGALAAPIAAYACRNIPTHVLTALVGVLLTVISIRTIYLTAF